MQSIFQEKILLHRVQTAHDGDAFIELYNEYVQPIYRFVALKVRSREDAEDIVSQTFLKAWQFLSTNTKEEEIKNFRAFIYKIARNTIIDSYREQRKKVEMPLSDTHMTEMPDPARLEEQVADKHEADALIQTLQKLKQEYQEIIFLRYVEELSLAEIAQIVQKNSTAVRVTLHRAMKKLKELSAGE